MLITLIAALAVAHSAVPAKSNQVAQRPQAATVVVPMTAGEIKNVLAGCLDESPYPADAGPLCFYPDGKALQMSGWGVSSRRYGIEGNRVIVSEQNGARVDTMVFFKDHVGRKFYRHEGGNYRFPLRALRLSKQR